MEEAEINGNERGDEDVDSKGKSHEVLDTTGLGEETPWDAGVGSALKLLQQKGFVNKTDIETAERSKQLSAREAWLAEQRLLQQRVENEKRLKREEDRRTGKFDKMTPRERELYAQQQNRRRELEQSRDQVERFKKYTPNVDLRYTDEFGRHLGPKEAFKQLSHQFHGKGSGKQKTEKRLAKIAKERELEKGSMSTVGEGDTDRSSAGMRIR